MPAEFSSTGDPMHFEPTRLLLALYAVRRTADQDDRFHDLGPIEKPGRTDSEQELNCP